MSNIPVHNPAQWRTEFVIVQTYILEHFGYVNFRQYTKGA